MDRKEEIRKAMLDLFDGSAPKTKLFVKEYYVENDPRTHYEKVKGE